jgi:uncharacterized damage-inducible protein DinB
MQLFYKEYINNLQELHNEIQSVIEGLPQDALDWIPGNNLNSISVLIFHISGAERYWLGDVVEQFPSGRNREAEFHVRNISIDALITRLNESQEYVSRVLERITLQDLEASRTSHRNNREVTVAWALNHILKHTALHVGHIQITRQLWEQNQKQ